MHYTLLCAPHRADALRIAHTCTCALSYYNTPPRAVLIPSAAQSFSNLGLGNALVNASAMFYSVGQYCKSKIPVVTCAQMK
jgi:hypothetical protein